jgi:hypothetical protein
MNYNENWRKILADLSRRAVHPRLFSLPKILPSFPPSLIPFRKWLSDRLELMKDMS